MLESLVGVQLVSCVVGDCLLLERSVFGDLSFFTIFQFTDQCLSFVVYFLYMVIAAYPSLLAHLLIERNNGNQMEHP